MTFGEDDQDDNATVMMTPEQLRAKLAQSVETVDASGREPKRKTVVSAGADDLCIEIMGLDGQTFTVQSVADCSIAALIARLIGSDLVLPVDQAGAIQGWYRLEVEGCHIDALQPVSSLRGASAKLVQVAASTRVVEVVVECTGKNLRFSSPMNTAVPIQSLVDHLRRWRARPDGQWHLLWKDQALADHQILNDLGGSGVLTLQLKLRST